MRSNWKIWVAAAAGIALVPQISAAGDVEEQLRTMNERLGNLEDRLQATTDELVSAQEKVSAQEEVLQRAGLEEEAGAKSSLSSFLEQTDFNGWVASSYTWNTSNKDNDAISNQSGRPSLSGQNFGTPFHPDSNTFQMDQLWFSMDKAPTEESRGGFHADILFGKTAEILGGSGGSLFGAVNTGGNDGVEIFTAYASYLAPILEGGVRIDAGEIPTLLGAEVVGAPYNFNITRGLVWGLQPVTNTGVLASTTFDNGFGIAVGAMNDVYSDANRDSDNDKVVTAQASYGDDVFSGAISFIYGSPVFDGGGAYVANGEDKSGMLDVVLTADPSDNLSIWFNFDWGFNRDIEVGAREIQDADVFAFALAGRLEVIEGTGVSLRGELVKEDDGYLGLGVGSGDSTLYSLTATIDHALSENLVARVEGRFDWADIDSGSDDIYQTSRGNFNNDDQQVLLAELIYNF